MYRRSSFALFPLGLVLLACSGEEPGGGNAAVGGNFGIVGGATGIPSGGKTFVGSGGNVAVAGGKSGAGAPNGGAASAGGTPGAGGITAAFTTASNGGSEPKGGSVTRGGTTSVGLGGTTAKGGSVTRGGTTSVGLGGTTAKGGSVATGGSTNVNVGGTTAKGGTTGAGGTTSSGGTATCSVSPANPKATQQVKNLLCYLYSIYGKSVLSGQQETSWSNPANDISWYNTNGMKYPAILGGDYLYPTGTTTRAIAYWNAGGITMIRYHMGAPPLADTYDNSKGSANIASVLTTGSSDNASFNSKLDYVATELKKLQDADVPVIWAPFHEFQPNGWFWWSKGTPAQFNQLWQYLFNYLTNTKGLNNLLWLAPSSGTPTSGWYPAKTYYDIAGPDTYETNPPFTAMYTATRSIVGTTVPIPLHETGMVPNPAQMFPSAAPWVLFNIWAGYQNGTQGTASQMNTLAGVKTAYEDSHTITRDEVPNLK